MNRKHTTGSQEWLMARDEAETVDCPTCDAPAGKHCRNTLTGDETRFPAHPLRIRASDPGPDPRQEPTP